jgi:membrane protease YdiL (CAAX protease family)
MEKRIAHPGFWMAVALSLVVVSVQVALSTPFGIIDLIFEKVLEQPPPRLAQNPWMLGFINLAAFGGTIALGLHLNRLPFRRAFPWRRITVLQLAGLAITLVGAIIFLSEADNVVRFVLPPPQWLTETFKAIFFEQGHLASRVFLLVLVAPLTEELLFRGIFLPGLLSRYRPGVAVLLTAALFAAIHLNPWQFLSALTLGSLIGWVYLRTGSIALCVFAHAIANGLSVVVSFIPVEIPGLTGSPISNIVEFQPWWLDITALALLVIGIYIFRKATPLRQSDEKPEPPVISYPPEQDPDSVILK